MTPRRKQATGLSAGYVGNYGDQMRVFDWEPVSRKVGSVHF